MGLLAGGGKTGVTGGAVQMDLPDASPDRTQRTRQLSDLRHGARADDARRGEAANPELVDMTRRFWVGVALSLPLVALAMTQHFWMLLPGPAAVWLQLVLATPVVLWCGSPFFQRGWASVINRRLNMFTLIALGTGVAYTYSVVAALLPRLFPAAFRMPDGDSAGLFRGGGGHRRRWCCSAKCSNCVRARRPAARSARCWTSRPRPRVSSAPTERR